MNIFFKTYQENDFSHRSSMQWRKYGIRSFRNLLYFLGYPPAKSLHFLDHYLNYEKVAAGQVLLKQDQVCDRLYFIIHGTLKIGRLHEHELQPLLLLNEGNLAVSFCDFLLESPSLETIKASSPCRLLWIDRSSYKEAVAKMDPEGIGTILNLLNYYTSRHVAWFQKNLVLNAKERVQHLREVYPDIFSLFPDADIAAFLGMTRETFSRTKKDVFRGINYNRTTG